MRVVVVVALVVVVVVVMVVVYGLSPRWSVINNRSCSMLKRHAVHDINKVSTFASISLSWHRKSTIHETFQPLCFLVIRIFGLIQG